MEAIRSRCVERGREGGLKFLAVKGSRCQNGKIGGKKLFMIYIWKEPSVFQCCGEFETTAAVLRRFSFVVKLSTHAHLLLGEVHSGKLISQF